MSRACVYAEREIERERQTEQEQERERGCLRLSREGTHTWLCSALGGCVREKESERNREREYVCFVRGHHDGIHPDLTRGLRVGS